VNADRFGFVRDLRAAGAAWLDDSCSSRAAALAYYTTFSIAPILVIAVAIASVVFERDAVLQSLLGEAHRLFGQEGAALIERLLLAARDEKNRGLAAVVAGAFLLVGATTAFAELKDTLDLIWRVPKSRISGIRGLLRARLLSFGLVLSIGFLLLVSLLVNTALGALSSALTRWFGLGTTLLVQAGSILLSLLVVGVLFTVIFKLLPTQGPSWRVSGRGALLTTALFLLGRAGIGAYLGNAATTSSFGAAGSLAVLLLWVYYSALIFYFGAEYTRVVSEKDAPPGL
jgi:membrane protein